MSFPGGASVLGYGTVMVAYYKGKPIPGSRISELPEILADELTDDDGIPVLDAAGAMNKRLTIEDLRALPKPATGVTVADIDANYAATDVEGVLEEVAWQKRYRFNFNIASHRAPFVNLGYDGAFSVATAVGNPDGGDCIVGTLTRTDFANPPTWTISDNQMIALAFNENPLDWGAEIGDVIEWSLHWSPKRVAGYNAPSEPALFPYTEATQIKRGNIFSYYMGGPQQQGPFAVPHWSYWMGSWGWAATTHGHPVVSTWTTPPVREDHLDPALYGDAVNKMWNGGLGWFFAANCWKSQGLEVEFYGADMTIKKGWNLRDPID